MVAALGAVVLIGVPTLTNEEEVEPERAEATYKGKRNKLERRLWQILREPRFKTAPERAEVVADIVGLGPKAVPLVFAVFSGEFTETFEEEGRAQMERPAEATGIDGALQDQVLLEALTLMPYDDVLEHLDVVVAESAPLERRLAATRVLQRLPNERSFALLLRLASEVKPIHLAHIRVQQPLEEAMRAILDAEPGATRLLARDLDRLPDTLLPLVARSLPVGRYSEGLRVLFKLLDRDKTLDTIVLSQVSELAGSIHDDALDDSLWHIHWLMNNPDWNLRRGSAIALGNLQDHTSCPQLIRMLEDQDRRVRQGALWALRNMSDRRFEEDPAAWLAWYQEETKWFETTAVRLEEQLASEDRAQVIEALAGLCQRPLYRHHVAKRLGPLVLDEDPDLVRAVSAALTQTGSRRTVPFLVRGLDHFHEEAVEATWQALKAVTGQAHPPERAVWERALNGS